ncbi:class I SAM-dependent methyltransferase [Sporolactobacillus vineae]|uniref:class I SAM-dependent methyltransferase n=1 Tax=Sporolactobacillus vineae TaxID=444463 RepID=UPI0002885EC8|nr:class I SAM-dependent methyltransferase [Sporolactobacillus vineae]
MTANRYLDFLAKLGVDHAHPGGKNLTDVLIRAIGEKGKAKVLDVGCGTGATAELLAAHPETDVTGIDLHPKMVEQARERAHRAGNTFKIVSGSAEALPFPDASFDWVLSESVTAFTRAQRSIAEYFRVLKPGGTFIADEMTVARSLTPAEADPIKALYGVPCLWTPDEWRQLLESAGFSNVQVIQAENFLPTGQDVTLPVFRMDEALDSSTFEVWLEHMRLLHVYHKLLTYRVYRGTKPDE